VIQDGARLHYAVPRALHRTGRLEVMFTEWYAGPGTPLILASRLASRLVPTVGKRMLERHVPDLDSAHIVTNGWLAAYGRLRQPLFPTPEKYFAWLSGKVAQWVARCGFGASNAIYGFVRNIAPSLCRLAAERGLAVVVDQMIAARGFETREALLQASRFPSWSIDYPNTHDRVGAIERDTWEAATRVTCPSDYVRSSLISEGVPADRVRVVPYPIATSALTHRPQSRRGGPLIVGFVGEVGLRKGAPYFLQVAKCFDPTKVRFVMAGPVRVSATARQELESRVELKGAIRRSQVNDFLAQCDIFLFPTTCEGSAGAVLEAMASGLAIVTSPNSGSPIRNDAEGIVLPYDEVNALAAAVERLVRDDGLRAEYGRRAHLCASALTIEAFGRQLGDVFGSLGNMASPT
jgi:glycosyltransferase involved in cell wall biosynthesis